MSTLTKVFVLLLAVFSIAFTSMTVSIATQTANWKEVAQRFEAHAHVADTNLRNLIASNHAEMLSAADSIEAHLDTIADLETKVESLGHEVEQQRVETRRLKAEHDGVAAMNRSLVARLQGSEASRDEYRAQRDELEKQSIDLQARNVDLNDRVNELTTQMSVLLEQKRQFEQQIHLLREENDKLARQARMPSSAAFMEGAQGASMSNVIAVTPVAPSAIRGQVLTVSDDLVTISIGSADGVKKGMVFVIHRQGSYVGDMRIDLIDPNESAGRLVTGGVTPVPGDQVTDAQGLAGARG